MKIVYILSTFNSWGGIPKKTLDLIQHSVNDCYVYMYEDGYAQFKNLFEEAGANITEGYYRRNIIKHISSLLNVIDKNDIQLVQTQFTMGEVLGFLIKYFRPHVKLVIAFVGPFELKGIKKVIVQEIYKKVDAFVFISNYVKNAKCNQFPLLTKKYSKIIFNGTEKRQPTNDDFPSMKHTSLYSSSGLLDWKNINILVEAINILKKKSTKQVFLYVAGDGPERRSIEKKINQFGLEEQIFLFGYQKNIGPYLNRQTYMYTPHIPKVLELQLLKQ